jgi:hypothetical protein
MADKFYAVTAIRHGKRDEDGSAEGKYTRTEFKTGDEVKGLDKETMKDLWEAGALRRETSEDRSSESEKEDTSTVAGGSASTTPTKTAPAKATAKAADK